MSSKKGSITGNIIWTETLVNSNNHCERNCERRWVGRRNRQHYLILMLPITSPPATPLAESDILVKNILKKRFGVMRKNEELNSAVKTNVGLQFLRLMANSFIPDNPIRILFNRSTVKVSLLLAKWTPRWAATTQYSWSTIPNTSILRAVTARRTRKCPLTPAEWLTLQVLLHQTEQSITLGSLAIVLRRDITRTVAIFETAIVNTAQDSVLTSGSWRRMGRNFKSSGRSCTHRAPTHNLVSNKCILCLNKIYRILRPIVETSCSIPAGTEQKAPITHQFLKPRYFFLFGS